MVYRPGSNRYLGGSACLVDAKGKSACSSVDVNIQPNRTGLVGSASLESTTEEVEIANDYGGLTL